MNSGPLPSPKSCAVCGSPVDDDSVCLACAFEDALLKDSRRLGNDDADASGEAQDSFGDFAPPVGGTFGKYQLIQELGSGGMGVIWEADDSSLRRTVALKMIRGFAFSGTGERQRFQREATAVAQLDHPNIVPIYEVGEIDGHPYFAMKRLSGGSLAARLAEGAMDQREAVVIMEKLARAIAHAHDRGVLHRDLKPDNVLFDDKGEPLLTDFGLAKIMDEGDGLTLTTAHVGTPQYMSPEQARGCAKDITEASDVWGAGALLFHMLTGQTPFKGKSSGEILHHVTHEKPHSMDDAVPSVGKDLRTLCLRCLEREPNQRLPSAQVLADEMARWLDGQPIATKPMPLAIRAWTWSRRRPVNAVALVSCLLVIAAFVASSVLDALEAGVLSYGDSISLRNLGTDEYLDTCGWVLDTELGLELRTQSLFVFTSEILNRGDTPTGTWQIEPAGESAPDTPLAFGDTIRLQSMYPGGGWLDNCGHLKHLHFYDEFADGQQNAVSTSLEHLASDQTDRWIVRSPEGKSGPIKIGDTIVLESAFPSAGHLNAFGEPSRIEAFSGVGFEEISSIVFVSEKEKVAGPSSQWTVGKTK